jgi:hypothetical protein
MSEQFIPGVYNYCDRWCERCTLTSRCRSYDGESRLSPQQLDSSNKAFWDVISSNFKDAINMIQKEAERLGIDLTAITKEEKQASEQRSSFISAAAKNHLLGQLCKQYQKLTLPFFKGNRPLMEKADELVRQTELGIIAEHQSLQMVAGMGDCIEIIQWYVFFIDAKLQRALHGKLEDDGREEEEGFQKDSDGSAKIALIAIERSMGAWKKLYGSMPESEDTILAALSLLEKLKSKSKEEFPKAEAFRRPGFDD